MKYTVHLQSVLLALAWCCYLSYQLFVEDLTGDELFDKVFWYCLIVMWVAVMLKNINPNMLVLYPQSWPMVISFIFLNLKLPFTLIESWDLKERTWFCYWLVISFDLGTLLSMYLYLRYDHINLQSYKVTGPYEVGYQKVFTKVNSQRIAIWYPMDRSEFATSYRDENAVFQEWQCPKAGIMGITFQGYVQKSMKAKDGDRIEMEIPTKSVHRNHTQKMAVCENGKLAKVFANGQEKLAPIIWSHGMGATANHYSSLCREMASYGYIAFSLDHHDRSVAYTEKENGEEVLIDMSVKFGDKQFINRQSAKRSQEMSQLIDEISSENWIQNKLNFPSAAVLNVDKVASGGQSFGGAASMLHTCQDHRVKAGICLDPYWKAVMEFADNGQLKSQVPILTCLSDGIMEIAVPGDKQGFSHQVRDVVVQNDNDNMYTFISHKGTHHMDQGDGVVLMPLLMNVLNGHGLRTDNLHSMKMYHYNIIKFLREQNLKSFDNESIAIDGKSYQQYMEKAMVLLEHDYKIGKITPYTKKV